MCISIACYKIFTHRLLDWFFFFFLNKHLMLIFIHLYFICKNPTVNKFSEFVDLRKHPISFGFSKTFVLCLFVLLRPIRVETSSDVGEMSQIDFCMASRFTIHSKKKYLFNFVRHLFNFETYLLKSST